MFQITPLKFIPNNETISSISTPRNEEPAIEMLVAPQFQLDNEPVQEQTPKVLDIDAMLSDQFSEQREQK